jgi:hypothetical protein
MNSRRSRFLITVTVAAVVIAMGACSSDDEQTATAPGTEAAAAAPTTPAEAPEMLGEGEDGVSHNGHVAPTEDATPHQPGAEDDAAAAAESEATAKGEAEVVVSPEGSLAEYYTKLGVESAVIACYVPQLTDLGVTTVNQLEDDQALGAQAADLFATCVAEVGSNGG